MVVMVVIVGVIVIVAVIVGVVVGVVVIVGAFCNFPFDDILVVSQRVLIVQIYLKHTLVRFSLKI
jgi:hypothetical protein